MTTGVRGDVRPVPDPTSLTTDQLQREIGILKEQVQREQSAQKELVFTRLDGLRELVFIRFDERDKAKAQAERDSKETLNKSLDSLTTNVHSLDERVRMLMPRSESEALHHAHDSRINAIIVRLNAADDRGTGARHNWGIILSVLSAATAVISVVVFMSKGL